MKKKFVLLLALIAGLTATKRLKAKRAEEELWNSAAERPSEK
ncbi:MAG TPA: DLW-39 family protein [Candidatus Nanopelagicaceae bacterium]|nr:DLW-39 family protein [Candidatus Nanopelagicaceae bacterium]